MGNMAPMTDRMHRMADTNETLQGDGKHKTWVEKLIGTIFGTHNVAAVAKQLANATKWTLVRLKEEGGIGIEVKEVGDKQVEVGESGGTIEERKCNQRVWKHAKKQGQIS